MISLAVILSLLVSGRETTRTCDRGPGGRSSRGIPCDSGPMVELAPESGAGMGAACACANITTASGNTTTMARASSGVCWTTVGTLPLQVSPGEMVVCGNNLPRVMPGWDGSSSLGLLSEPATTNLALRSEELNNAAWIATATVTADTTSSPTNTTTGDTLDDVSAAALQGVTQVIATSSLTQHTFGVWLRAGTASSATVSFVGTGNAAGDCSTTSSGLSSSAWRFVSCTSAAAYAAGLTAVTVSIAVGTVIGDTGTIIAWGAQHEVGTSSLVGPSSYVATTSGSASRVVEILTVNGIAPSVFTSSGCASGTISTIFAHSVFGTIVSLDSNGRPLYLSPNAIRSFDGVNNPTLSLGLGAGPGTKRIRSTWSASTITIFNDTDTTSASSSFDGTMAATAINLAGSAAGGTAVGVYKRIQLDPTPSRCL